ncbi:hypothetical protein [Salinivibrio costicola]|uniref:hypothetical protein n=1 Tax=Salinivibrio costicola TaxID=51367 RepID=UPI003F6E5123
MKTISIAEFEKLVARTDWERHQEHEVVEKMKHQLDDWGERGIPVDDSGTIVTHAFGWASITSTHDNIKITYQEGFDYVEFEPESLNSSPDDLNEAWFVQG